VSSELPLLRLNFYRAPLLTPRPPPLALNSLSPSAAKFLVDKKGNVIERYAPTTDPAAIRKDIEKLL
jgi:glutathione peroxidase